MKKEDVAVVFYEGREIGVNCMNSSSCIRQDASRSADHNMIARLYAMRRIFFNRIHLKNIIREHKILIPSEGRKVGKRPPSDDQIRIQCLLIQIRGQIEARFIAWTCLSMHGPRNEKRTATLVIRKSKKGGNRSEACVLCKILRIY